MQPTTDAPSFAVGVSACRGYANVFVPTDLTSLTSGRDEFVGFSVSSADQSQCDATEQMTGNRAQ